MPEFYTWTILLQLDEIGDKQLPVLGSRGGQIRPLILVPQIYYIKIFLEV